MDPLPLAYRSASPEAPQPDRVEISRQEYASLRRAQLILRHLDNPDGADIWDSRTAPARRRWEVVLYQHDEDYTGYGKSLSEAVEDALGLPPAVIWLDEETPVPWKRFVLLGAALALVTQLMVHYVF